MSIQDKKIYEQLYKRAVVTEEDVWICFYCGETADTVDHHPPISRVTDYRALYGEPKEYIKVGCCKECNAILSNSITETLKERKKLLNDKLSRRYSRILRQPDWSSTDFKEAKLKGKLKRYVKNKDSEKKQVLKRLRYNSGACFHIRH